MLSYKVTLALALTLLLSFIITWILYSVEKRKLPRAPKRPTEWRSSFYIPHGALSPLEIFHLDGYYWCYVELVRWLHNDPNGPVHVQPLDKSGRASSTYIGWMSIKPKRQPALSVRVRDYVCRTAQGVYFIVDEKTFKEIYEPYPMATIVNPYDPQE